MSAARAPAVDAISQIVISRKDELLEIEADEPEMLHAILSKLPKPLDLESLLRRTSEIFELYPPPSLPGRAWSRVSANSVLKTTRDPDALGKQSLEDGERMFERQAAEIRRAEAWKRQKLRARQLARKYRWPATYTSTAIVVAIIAYWFRGSGAPVPLPGWTLAFARVRQQGISILQQYLL